MVAITSSVIEIRCRLFDSRLARESVRVGERPGITADHEPVRSGAVGRDAGVLGQGTTLVNAQPDVPWRRGELGVDAAKALCHRLATLDVEPLARGKIPDPQQERDLVDLPRG